MSTSSPTSLFFELMDFTSECAKAYFISPFDVLNTDAEDVFLMMNYWIEKGQNDDGKRPEMPSIPKSKHISKNQRIRVNDKTATGGWW